MTVLPSGEQVEIACGHLRATIVEVGGGLRTLTADDLEIVDGFAAHEMCHDGRGQVLMPWPNRLAGGRHSFTGQEEQLPINEPSQGNSIHGLVRWLNWNAESRASDGVIMTLRLHPMPGYPFALDLAVAYSLSDEGLAVTMRATNIGDDACPFGAGQHPYFRAGTERIDEALLRIPAQTMYRYDDHFIPVERVSVAGTPLDFRTLRRIGDTVLDRNFTDMERDAEGRSRVTLQASQGSPSVEVWMDKAFRHVTVYSGETVQPAERRRLGLAVEPMTCAPNAFASGDDLQVLQPGETWEGRWGVVIHRM
jgi:aldose 1-epimerase